MAKCACGADIDDDNEICDDCWIDNSRQCVGCSSTFYAPNGEKVCSECAPLECRYCRKTVFDSRDGDVCDDCYDSFFKKTCSHCEKDYHDEEDDERSVCPFCHYNSGLQSFVCVVCSAALETHYTDTVCQTCKERLTSSALSEVRKKASRSVTSSDGVGSCGVTTLSIIRNDTDEEVWEDERWIIGQLVSLTLENSADAPMANVRWSIGGECIAKYLTKEGIPRRDVSYGCVIDLSSSDLGLPHVEFYWIAGGKPKVTVAADINGKRLSVTITARVVGLSKVSITSETTAMSVAKVRSIVKSLHLTFGGDVVSKTPGIKWKCKAKAPVGGKGRLACTQLIRIDRDRVRSDNQHEPLSSNGEFVLDEVLHYDINPPDEEEIGEDDDPIPTVEIGSGKTAEIVLEDSPAMPLSRAILRVNNVFYDRVSMNDAFRVYFMYRPDGDNNIFVTISYMEWSCSGVAIYNIDRWELQSGAQSANPSGNASFELPEWMGNRHDIM